MPWVEVASRQDVLPGTGLECVAGDRIVALYDVDGELFAMDGLCAHQGGPLGKGTVQGCIVTCPWHGWQYNVTNGQSLLATSVRQELFPVRVEDDRVLVLLPHES